MNKVIKSLLSLFLFTAAISGTRAQNLETILEKHFEAVGQKSLVKKQSMTVSGRFTYQALGLELPMKMYIARPNKIRVEGEFQNQKFIQAFDGEDGWIVAPWMGSTEPKDLDGQSLRQIRDQGDIDGLLYNYEQKGFQLSYEGKGEAEGKEVYELKLIKKDGTEIFFFIDAQTYLISKQSGEVAVNGASISNEIFMSDYRTVGGVSVPFLWVTKANGQVVAEIKFDNLIFDQSVSASIFKRPANE